MRTIMVLNAKGGCGKTTLATNLASYYAVEGYKVALVDFDEQLCSSDWLSMRPEDREEIHGITAEEGKASVPRGMDIVIMDVPAGLHHKALNSFVSKVQSIIIPVLPSPIDIRACARFVQEIFANKRIQNEKTRIAVVANRVRENTIIYHSLEHFLKKLRSPFIATLRDTQNYNRAANRGLGIFELAPSLVAHDVEQWEPLLKWLRSKRSLPKG